MWQIFVYIEVFILAFIAIYGNAKTRKGDFFVRKFVYLSLVILACTRNYSGYPDYIGYNGYEQEYNRFAIMSFESIIDQFDILKDPVYYLVGSVFGKLGLPFRIWIAVIAVFSIAALINYVWKYSQNRGLSMLLYCTFGYFFFSLCGLRQAIAIGFIFYAYIQAKEQHLVKFCVLVVMATMFHESALIFLPAYFIISREKPNKRTAMLLVPIAVILLIRSDLVISFLKIIIINDTRFEGVLSGAQEGLNATNGIIFTAILIYSFTIRHANADIGKQIDCLTLLVIGWFFRMFSMVMSVSFRLAMYYDIFIISYIPERYIGSGKNKTDVKTYAIIGMCLLYFVFFSGRSFGAFNW
ncbi:EpsG family protein [Heliophilum fasciatum]|uniref:EpsG-like putative glucosyltransferase n=1 Tax=Heliophilum fasciatum TaxID=35700 RepID=A0A4R2RJV8_9FIRM|nr:EpsG family protein [Heliophilum fasciatum]MCW2278080.1 hypothetical protein [Heliophilum fasciatum]TCP64152.1 EpsG-like putative glucosyltransferase [Heliophilum fasciatum]